MPPGSAGTSPWPLAKPKQTDQIYQIYMDFNADLPDSLFEAPRPGRIH